MGAIASGGIRVLNDEVVRLLGLHRDVIEHVAERESRELQRRERLYRADRPLPDLRNRIVILVDDGLATGSTMRAAARAVREQAPDRVVVAVPTAPADTCDALKAEVDEVVCVSTPETFTAVGQSYEEFSQLTDVEVRDLLERGSRW
jgi:predicted phosphoribosyltransferase